MAMHLPAGVEALDELHSLAHLLRVDRDRLAVFGHVGGAIGPHDREQRDVGVAAVAEGGAEGMADGFALLPDPQPVLPGVGGLLADLLQEVGPHGHRERRLPPRQQLPLAADQVVVGIQPAAALGRDVARDVVQIDEVVVVEVGIPETGAEGGQVVPGARLDLGRFLSLQLEVGDDVESHLHLVLGAPLLELPLQLFVGLGNEARDGQEGELSSLSDRRCGAGDEDAAEPGGASGSHAKEVTPAHAT
jgi:hypothetical protein